MVHLPQRRNDCQLNEHTIRPSATSLPTQAVVVRLFAGAAEIAGARSLTVQVPIPTSLAALATAVCAAEPRLSDLVAISRWAVGNEFIESDFQWPDLSHNLTPEIAMIPPVSGG